MGFSRPPFGLRLALVLAVSAAALASPALAEEESDEAAAPDAATPSPPSWEFSLMPYGWLTNVSGHADVRGVSSDLSVNFWSDVLHNLDGAFMGEGEAVYQGRWILNLDSLWAQVSPVTQSRAFEVGFGPRTFERSVRRLGTSIPVETPVGTLEVPVRIDPSVLRVDVPRVDTTIGPFDVNLRSVTIETRALLGYRVLDAPELGLLGLTPKDDRRRLRVDLLAGLRYWYVKTTVDVQSPPIRIPEFKVTSSLSGGTVRVGGQHVPAQTVAIPRVDLAEVSFPGTTFGGTDIHEDTSTWWIDPVLGLRVGGDLTEKLSVTLCGNIGGFDIGSASKFSWEAMGLLSYRLGENWSVAAGYRALGLERVKGDTQLDVVLHGPQIGIAYRF